MEEQPIAVVDKLTGEVLRVYRSVTDASTGESVKPERIREQVENNSFGRGWTTFRYVRDMGREMRVRGRKCAPVILSDANIDVAFRSSNAAAEAVGMHPKAMRQHLKSGQTFVFEGMEVFGFVPEVASVAFRKARRYDR